MDLTKEMFDTIDFTRLEIRLSKMIGIDIVINAKLDSDSRITLISNELKDYTGICSQLYKTYKLCSFGRGIIRDGCIWFNLNFSFEYKAGGSNGHHYTNAYYNYKIKKWTVEPTRN